jgi:hypothetical protein
MFQLVLVVFAALKISDVCSSCMVAVAALEARLLSSSVTEL